MKPEPEVPLLKSSIDNDPFRQFARWYQAAEQAGIPLSNAVQLATATADGKPSARMVLLKDMDDRGFIFYTNYNSLKASQIKENPFAALVFYWLPHSRQIRIEGAVERLDLQTSDAYFASRPRGSQIEAHASPQSQVVRDRQALLTQYAQIVHKFEGRTVPRPDDWGGYRVVPQTFEFWQEGQNRLHDRLRYRRDEAGLWVIERLAP